jgi:hypothetical protein
MRYEVYTLLYLCDFCDIVVNTYDFNDLIRFFLRQEKVGPT